MVKVGRPAHRAFWGASSLVLAMALDHGARAGSPEAEVASALEDAVGRGDASRTPGAARSSAAPVAPSAASIPAAEVLPRRWIGLTGAAAAAAIGDDHRVLALLDAATEAESSPRWVVAQAMRGRALRRLGRFEAAVAVLEQLWAKKSLDEAFPADVLGRELALAQLAWARTLPPARAEAQRDAAISVLGVVRRHPNLRNLAEIRVLEARAMLELQGSDERTARRRARQASDAAARVLRDYPRHPEVGAIWLAQARALERSGNVRQAAHEYREIFIQRAGEVEAEQAWKELERVAAEHTWLQPQAQALAVHEQIRRAVVARDLRWVDLSREILDTVIDDPSTSPARRDEALGQRSWTAYKQRDFARCADDVRPGFQATGNFAARNDLLRCLERGEMYDEALAIWAEQAKSTSKAERLHARWEAANLAFRAGRYAQAEHWLGQYELESKGHAKDRAWLHAWIPMRLGRVDDAVAGFEVVERYPAERTRARYFRGRLLVRSAASEDRALGADLLGALIESDPYAYYALQARQRLVDAGLRPPELPPIFPIPEEADHPTRAENTRRLRELDEEFGAGWPSVRRQRQLYEAGYLEEARRELRISIEGYLARGRSSGGPVNEALEVGGGWRANWTAPRVALTKEAYRDLRSPAKRERLRVGLRDLSRGLDEPYRFIKLGLPDEGHWKARWQPRGYRSVVEREARLQQIDPVHLWSLMYTESRFRRFVVSPVGARGALQIMPWTARQLAARLGELENGRFDDDRLFEIDVNAHLSSYYVAELLRKFHGQGPLAYASYNGGPSNVARWLAAKSNGPVPLEMDVLIEEMVFQESYRYTKRVMEVFAVYGLLYEGKLRTFDNRVDPVFEDNIDF